MDVLEEHNVEELDSRQADGAAPIFILGIMPRSGTNFLHRLLCRHPDCGAVNTTPVREDYLVHHAGWLSRYLGRLKWQWGHWGADAEFVAPMAGFVGRGLTGFLQSLTDAPRVVTKTPSVANLDSFFDYFPHAYLLVIVRDGRSVVASGMSGFGWRFETATRQWAKSARRILEFEERHASCTDRFRIVQYERLSADTVNELKRIFSFLNLDENCFDFDEALNLPVYGSSFLKQGDGQVTWKPREKSKDFDASERWSKWEAARHDRFNWIAGRELEALGYESFSGDSKRERKLYHRWLDMLYHLRRIPGRLMNAVRAGFSAFRRDWVGEGQTNVNLKR